MQKFEISDRALKEAAGAVVTSLLGALPEPEELAHDFSDGFEEKMRLVIAKEKRHSAFRKFGRRAAAVILAALVGMGAWLAVDQESRAMVSQWIRTVYESSVIYRFFGAAPEGELPDYRPAWVPDGYVEVQSLRTESERVLVYQSSDSAFTLTYHWMDEATGTTLDGISGESRTVSVQGNPGFYYPSAGPGSTNDLIWTDESSGLVFILSAYLPEHDILHIAESVELSDIPK